MNERERERTREREREEKEERERRERERELIAHDRLFRGIKHDFLKRFSLPGLMI